MHHHSFLRSALRLPLFGALLLVLPIAVRADWRLLPALSGGSFTAPMMNRNGRLITTERQLDNRYHSRFVVYDVGAGRRLFDRYWTQASNEESPFRFMILDTNDAVTLAFSTETAFYVRRYNADGTLLTERQPSAQDSFPRLTSAVISPWNPGYVHSYWFDNLGGYLCVQTSSTALHVLRTDTLRIGAEPAELEPDGTGGYYLLWPVPDSTQEWHLGHVSSDGELHGPISFETMTGFGAGSLCYAPGSRTLLAFSAQTVDDNHMQLYCLHFDPDSLVETSQEFMSSYVNMGSFCAAQDTIWFAHQVTPPAPPVIHQGIALWAYTPASGWVATDSITAGTWPIGDSILLGFYITVYPYLTLTPFGGDAILARFLRP